MTRNDVVKQPVSLGQSKRNEKRIINYLSFKYLILQIQYFLLVLGCQQRTVIAEAVVDLKLPAKVNY